MKQTLWFAILLLAAPIAKADTAEEMLSACRPVAEARVSHGNVTLPTTVEAGVCWGAFAVIQAETVWVEPGTKTRHFDVCTPENATRTQLIAIFVGYIERKPKRYTEDFASVVFEALRESFPCGARKQNS